MKRRRQISAALTFLASPAGKRLRSPPDVSLIPTSLRPFALNSHYVLQPPLDSATRAKIYADHAAGGAGARELASRYNVSLERVRAVVRMREVAARWQQEGTGEVQERFARAMDQLTHARPRSAIDAVAVLGGGGNCARGGGRPTEVPVDVDAQSMTRVEAARLLRKPIDPVTGEIPTSRRSESSRRMRRSRAEGDDGRVVAKDETLAGARFRFAFTDIGRHSERDVLVRERDGTLRVQ